MRIGYLRVSTEEQRPDRQIDGMTPLCDAMHVEKVSACAARRPVFDAVLAQLNAGDTLVVWDLDRAFRNARDALATFEALEARGVEIEIASLPLDMRSCFGKLIYTFISAIAEFERNHLSERTRQGMAAAKRRGQVLGRRPKLSAQEARQAADTIAKGEATAMELARRHGVHVTTLRRRIAKTRPASARPHQE